MIRPAREGADRFFESYSYFFAAFFSSAFFFGLRFSLFERI